MPEGGPAVFTSEYVHTLDAKGRLFIPARLREGLGARFILTKGLDHCLFAYPPAEWEALGQKFRDLPFARADVRAFARLFFSGACECECDRQGRILIPAYLREYAGLAREAVILGVAARVEIWAREEWERYRARATAAYEEVAEKLVDLF